MSRKRRRLAVPARGQGLAQDHARVVLAANDPPPIVLTCDASAGGMRVQIDFRVTVLSETPTYWKGRVEDGPAKGLVRRFPKSTCRILGQA